LYIKKQNFNEIHKIRLFRWTWWSWYFRCPFNCWRS